jgi:hypothetical protein
MKHLLLYENYEDDLPDMARDFFDLYKTFEIKYTEATPRGDKEAIHSQIKGPAENYHLALPLMQKLQDAVSKLENLKGQEGEYINEIDIEDIIWDNLDAAETLEGLGYYFYYWINKKWSRYSSN